jgi:NAD(P)H-flavin reductase
MADETMINSLNKDRHSNESFELGPITVVTREPLAPNVELLTVRAPVVASKIQPGQFVIIWLFLGRIKSEV